MAAMLALRRPGGVRKLSRSVIGLLLARILYTLQRRWMTSFIPRSLRGDQKPFMAFSGSGLLLAYFHGIVTYLRDHFHVDNLQLSGISGGCSTILALAMGLDLYQILLLGLHMKKHFLKTGVYLNDFEEMVDFTMQHWRRIGLTDEDVAELAARRQCHIGVTQCFPPGHRCVPTPGSLRELVALTVCSMNVVPFFRAPGVFEGKYCIDGGFSAMYSVPQGQRWDEVIKVTCFPWWATLMPPALGTADIQPKRFMPTEVLLLYPWEHQQQLIKLGYQDAQRQHSHLVARGLRPLRNAPLTPWAEWESLFAGIDEDHLPPLDSKRSTVVASELEKHHDEVLRTYSHSDLKDVLKGPRLRRYDLKGSRSEANCPEPAYSIAPSLAKLFNTSLAKGTLPTEWKLARVVSIPKSDDLKKLCVWI